MSEESIHLLRESIEPEHRDTFDMTMDSALKEIFDNLEKRRHVEEWSSEKWAEELEAHPFFKHHFDVKSKPTATASTEGNAPTPSTSEDVPTTSTEPAPEATDSVTIEYTSDEEFIYDPTGVFPPLSKALLEAQAKLAAIPKPATKGDTPAERALNYKLEGNYFFRRGNYRLAALSYTRGLKLRAEDPTVNGCLYNNRAAAMWHLMYFRSALHDCEKALTYNPNYTKARVCAAKSAFISNKLDSCIEHCQILLQTQPEDKEIRDLLVKARAKQESQEREARERRQRRPRGPDAELKRKIRDLFSVRAIFEQGIRFVKTDDATRNDWVETPENQSRHINVKTGAYRRPAAFCYPEFGTVDFLQGCEENLPLITQLRDRMYPLPWDEQETYRPDSINIYFRGMDGRPHLIDHTKPFADILAMDHIDLEGGSPIFIVMSSERLP